MGSVKTEEKIAVMQAAVDGKKIQLRSFNGEEWATANQPLTWDWQSYEYRVRPGSRVLYCNEYQGRLGYMRESPKDAIENQSGEAVRVIRFVEDMDYKGV